MKKNIIFTLIVLLLMASSQSLNAWGGKSEAAQTAEKYLTCINEDNISQVASWDFVALILRYYPGEDWKLASYVTKDNIVHIDTSALRYLMEQNAKTAQHFASCITAHNFEKAFCILPLILEHYSIAAKDFSSYITKDSLEHTRWSTLEAILKHYPAAAKDFAACITQENFERIPCNVLGGIMMYCSAAAQQFSSYITPENIVNMSQTLVATILKYYSCVAQEFAQYVTAHNVAQMRSGTIASILNYDSAATERIVSYINRHNIEQMSADDVNYILLKCPTAAAHFASCITKSNVGKVCSLRKILDCYPDAYERIVSYISPENISSWEVVSLLCRDSSLAQQFVSCITPSNVMHINFRIILKDARSIDAKKKIVSCVKEALEGGLWQEAATAFSNLDYLVSIYRSLACQFASCITKDTIVLKGSARIIKTICKYHPSAAPEFAALVNADNFSSLLQNGVIAYILTYCPDAAQRFAAFITEDNILDIDAHILSALLELLPQSAQQLASCITSDNIICADMNLIACILHHYPQAAKRFATFITPNNIAQAGACSTLLWNAGKHEFRDYIYSVGASLIATILYFDPTSAKQFASYIAYDMTQANRSTITSIIYHYPGAAKQFASCITPETIGCINTCKIKGGSALPGENAYLSVLNPRYIRQQDELGRLGSTILGLLIEMLVR